MCYSICYYQFMAPVSSQETMWIACDQDTLRQWQCTFDAYKAVGIRQDQPDTNVDTFVQDFILSSTFFIWTVVAVALMYSWWLYITAKDDAAATKWKNGIKRSFIGIILVVFAYTIIRVVQYVARG